MGEILTSAQMRAKEKRVMQAGEVTGLGLMERAGQGVLYETFREFPDLDKCKAHAVVLCGPGNNGGDGFVIARGLFERGWQVEVFFWGKAEKLSDDARQMHDAWAALGPIHSMTPQSAGQGERPTLLFDAMFGIGISRPIPIECALSFHAVCDRASGDKKVICIAVDCPSGVDVDTGATLLSDDPSRTNGDTDPRMIAERTDVCVTFHAPKLGHCLAELGRHPVAVVDIGLDVVPADAVIRPDGVTRSIPPLAPETWLKEVTGLGRGGHKYTRGHALILAGGVGKGGAGRMAARAALRAGAGLVTLGVPSEALAENAAHLNAIMLTEISSANDVSQALEDTRLSSVCLGPGLGVGMETRDRVLAVLRATASDGRRVVLDADALSSFADAPEVLFEACHENVVITPHEGEFARLFPDLAEKVRIPDPSKQGLGKVEATKLAAERLGATVLLKGEATVLADQRGASAIHSALYDRAVPWLGTAGAGDVLAGIIAGLTAHQMAATSAMIDLVAAAVWLHAQAARSFGPGLIAEDLPEQLPDVFRECGF
jgi:hydroxyethylthiazole kinase-like uncharacterized protein yjeF